MNDPARSMSRPLPRVCLVMNEERACPEDGPSRRSMTASGKAGKTQVHRRSFVIHEVSNLDAPAGDTRLHVLDIPPCSPVCCQTLKSSGTSCGRMKERC